MQEEADPIQVGEPNLQGSSVLSWSEELQVSAAEHPRRCLRHGLGVWQIRIATQGVTCCSPYKAMGVPPIVLCQPHTPICCREKKKGEPYEVRPGNRSSPVVCLLVGGKK